MSLHFNPKAPQRSPTGQHLDGIGGVEHGFCESQNGSDVLALPLTSFVTLGKV